MVKGIGTDIVSIKRFSDAMDKWGDKFTSRLFTTRELGYCNSKARPAIHLAARFAAKEALYKASSGLVTSHINFNQMEVINDSSGKPSMEAKGFEGLDIMVTMSHEKEFATSTVIIQLSATGL